MSGIAGVFNLDGSPVAAGLLDGMLRDISHLGPDDSGLWLRGVVGFAHTQLRTTPESRYERQPLTLCNDKYTIVWDGRVDNRPQLIEELGPEVSVTEFTPDAELALWSYVKWGDDAPKRLVGDFAFVIWDDSRQRIFAARDPMGLRTVYYHLTDDAFVFASDIRAITNYHGVAPRLNKLMVGLHLLGRNHEAEQTYYQGINQIAPAGRMSVDVNGVNKDLYWQPRPWDVIEYDTLEEYVEHFRTVFRLSVESKIRGITPIGITLSGGMDSTSIACTAADIIKRNPSSDTKLTTFSSVFDDHEAADERSYIRHVLEKWDLEHNFILSDNLWAFKPLQSRDVFFSQPYAVPFQARHEGTLQLARKANVRVILTGEGGDEQLNPGFAFLLDHLMGFRLRKLRQELKFVAPNSRKSFYKAAFWALVPERIKRVYSRVRVGKAPRWMNYQFLKSSGALSHTGITTEGHKFKDLHTETTFVGLRGLSRQPHFTYIRELWESYQVEPRHPFLDLRVIDFLSRLPPHLKFKQGWTKYLLRKAMEGVLPDEIISRPGKTIFNDLLVTGYREEKDRIGKVLRDSRLISQGWVDGDRLRSYFDDVVQGNLSPGNRVMLSVLTYEDWMANYFDSNGGGTFAPPGQILVKGS
ncbi:MAG: hypothetical protein IIB16_05655 [Chloroflexi bacterium]|nr:hypothetical protein [Chloroflexota bacterium]